MDDYYFLPPANAYESQSSPSKKQAKFKIRMREEAPRKGSVNRKIPNSSSTQKKLNRYAFWNNPSENPAEIRPKEEQRNEFLQNPTE